ncbi:CHAT domain-containing tetratricopeptide repeat protein [Phenylobacterium sp.]|uniref:CHAT domain-containing tetratricopeptide repeat protein n=1 Tax=Phenylobacterium sp. TaxID=1871053 RepID=UPI002E31F6FD|nr:CHAT domain-containing tetratricopeptide repeat protein [Phenylobacterium sp.]HEX3366498.1 CHAT domain-containing tetratricopeptide repeat protein [Phenylobacterium sp.]
MIDVRAGVRLGLLVLAVAAGPAARGAAAPGAAPTAAAVQPASPPADRAPTAEEAAELDTLTKAYLAARDARRWDEAERVMRRALAIEEATYGPRHPQVAVALGAIADTLEETDRYAQAEPLLRRALEIRRAALGDRDPDTAMAYNNLAYCVDAQGRYAEAEPLFARALEIARAALGERSAVTAGNYNNLAANLSAQGRYAEAEPLYRTALEIRLATQGARDPVTALSYANLGGVLSAEGRAGDAEPMFRKAYEIRHAALGPRDPALAGSLNDLAYNLGDQGKYAEAEPLLREALAIRTTALGEGSSETAASRNNLGTNLGAQGRYAEAEPLLSGALATFRTALGERHPSTAAAETNLAANLNAQGRYGEAEPLYRAGLETRRAMLGERHPATAIGLNNLAVNLEDQGRYAEAEALFARALEIRQAALGEDHPETAQSYGNLAAALKAQGRYGEAEPLFRKALEIRRAALGERHPLTAASADSLAANLDDQGHFAEAEPLYRQALETRRATLGERHPLTAASENNLAYNLDSQGRLAEAEPLYRHALEVRRAVLGQGHPVTATSVNNLAAVLDGQGRRAEAEGLYRQALEIRRATLGELHPDTATSYANLAFSLGGQDRFAEAEGYALTAADAMRQLRRRERGVAEDRDDGAAAPADDGAAFRIYLAAAAGVAEQGPAERRRVRAPAFLAAQDLDRSAAGAALAQAAARVAAGQAGLADTVRREQDLAVMARGYEARLLQALGAGDAATAATMRGELQRSGDELARLHAQVRARFPRYAELVSPEALDLAAVQARLGPGEGLLLIVPSDVDVHVFALSRTHVEWRRAKGAARAVAQKVTRLRCQTDPGTCQLGSDPGGGAPDDLPPFDRRAAFELYRDLVQPVESALKGVKTLYVTSTGPLSGLPLAVLQTQAPGARPGRDANSLKAAPWFADRYALVTLPTVSSLRALGALKAPAHREALAGYGDPVLAGYQAAQPPAARPRGGLRVFRGVGADGLGLADPATLRQGFAALPGTRAELTAMAAALGAPASALHMGPQATEAAVKASLQLPQARVVIFATHGLLPHALKGLDEPGLVLTPPTVPTPDDDGVLTASEAARLSLSADWVILSACNTAAADGAPGAETLSGLAKAFLYAGARALLVSHWEVGDEVTAALTVQTIALKRAHPELSKAAALQAAMRAVRTGVLPGGKPVAGWQPIWAHPGSWAPFVLVSAGG